MPYLTPNDSLDAIAADIRTHFADVSLDFYNDYLSNAVGLEVHVRTKNRLKDVREYCTWLQRNPPNDVPVKIKVS